MPRLSVALVAPAFLAFATPASADLSVAFVEGAPKDRFRIVNTGACAVGPGSLQIDLGDAVGGLIFDVTGNGAGVEVFQPFEVSSGGAALTALPRVVDGDQRIDLALAVLPAGAELSFTIDVDDTAGTRAITVSGSEMAGAVVRFDGASGAFDGRARAVVSTPACPG